MEDMVRAESGLVDDPVVVGDLDANVLPVDENADTCSM